MADCVTGEAGKGDDAERRFVLADCAQRKKVVANEIAVARDDERAGNNNVQERLRFKRRDEFADLDAAQQVIENDGGDDNDRKADCDVDPASRDAAEKRLRKRTRCCDRNKNVSRRRIGGGKIPSPRDRIVTTIPARSGLAGPDRHTNEI